MNVRWRRSVLLRCLPWLFALAVAVILVDLFFFRYRALGPTLFLILCFPAGIAVGRAQPMDPLEGAAGVAHRVFLLFMILPFLGVGIMGLLMGLLMPFFSDLPDNASFMWDVWSPDGRRHYVRDRGWQLYFCPASLWVSGVMSALVVCPFFVRPGSQENAGVAGEVSSAEAGGRVAAGAHPWAYTGGLYLILLLVLVRAVLSEDAGLVVLSDRAGPEGNESQRWELRDAGKGLVVIVNQRNAKALHYDALTMEARLDSTRAAQVRPAAENVVAGSIYQRWVLVDVGGGKVLIRNELKRLVLDYHDEGPKAGHVYLEGQQGDKGGEAQAWMLQRVEGRVVIVHVQTGKVLDCK